MRKALKGRLSFIEGPDDEVFARLLLAADLIVLPYDAGISERRSSFFSAVACGGNVLTTSGRFTSPLGLERSGAHVVPVERWAAGDTQALQSVTDAFLEDERAVLTRRLKNLAWAEERSWENRAALIMDFISTL
ncbi:MAG: hypothetical protein HY074_20505 [Deltaproteobacteria bacterium]|nr:hypothetical protein [Deltaproteobacteria bacterium]